MGVGFTLSYPSKGGGDADSSRWHHNIWYFLGGNPKVISGSTYVKNYCSLDTWKKRCWRNTGFISATWTSAWCGSFGPFETWCRALTLLWPPMTGKLSLWAATSKFNTFFGPSEPKILILILPFENNCSNTNDWHWQYQGSAVCFFLREQFVPKI